MVQSQILAISLLPRWTSAKSPKPSGQLNFHPYHARAIILLFDVVLLVCRNHHPRVGLYMKESGFDIFENYQLNFDFFVFGKNLTTAPFI